MRRLSPLVITAVALLGGCGGDHGSVATSSRAAASSAATTTPRVGTGVRRLDAAPGEPQSTRVVRDGSGGALAATELRSATGGYPSCESNDDYSVRLVHVAKDAGRVRYRLAMPGSLEAGPVALHGGRAAMLVAVSRPGSNTCDDDGTTLTLVTVDARGRVVARRTLESHAEVSAAAMVTDSSGRPQVAWVDMSSHEERFALRLAAAPERGGASSLLDVRNGVYPQDPGIDAVALARAPGGGLLVVWSAAGRVRAVDVAASGRRRSPVSLGPTNSLVDLSVAESASGRAIVAWGSTDGGEERNTPYVVRAALRPDRATGFGPAQVLDPGAAIIEPANPVLARIAPGGRAAVAWVNSAGGETGTPLKLAQAAPGARMFSATQRLELVASLDDMRLSGRDDLVVATTRGGGSRVTTVGAGGLRARRSLTFEPLLLLDDSPGSPVVGVDRGTGYELLGSSR